MADDNTVSSEAAFFEEKDEVLSLIAAITGEGVDVSALDGLVEQVAKVLEKYQEQSSLLDPALEDKSRNGETSLVLRHARPVHRGPKRRHLDTREPAVSDSRPEVTGLDVTVRQHRGRSATSSSGDRLFQLESPMRSSAWRNTAMTTSPLIFKPSS